LGLKSNEKGVFAMREVAVVGIGQTPVNEHWDKSLRILAGEAVLAGLNDARRETVDGLFVGNMMSGTANHQQQLGALIADWVGLRYTEAVKIEAACGSGAAAFRAALMAVSSGQMDSAVVVGVEKMTDSPGGEITAALATASDAEWELEQGLSFVAINALAMQRYMHIYGWKHADFAAFSINAHNNAIHNPNARFHEGLTEASYAKAPMIADPINLMDASPMGDGAAAVVLIPVDCLHDRAHTPAAATKHPYHPLITVVGSAADTDTIALHSRSDPLWLSAAEISSRQAYAQAGIGPADIDVFELHDAFSIMAALSLEASGFAERGQGPRLANEGEIRPQGRIPIATRGGLKARGHPVGATGVYQIVEVVQQLRGEAGETQVVDPPRIRRVDPHYGMAQNIGGSGSNIITHIFKRSQ
jgi:acetyl-CoA C-acetyltransferase